MAIEDLNEGNFLIFIEIKNWARNFRSRSSIYWIFKKTKIKWYTLSFDYQFDFYGWL
jgi:hypothetical protein